MMNGIDNLNKSTLIMFSAFGVALFAASSFVQSTSETERGKNLMWACSLIYFIIYLTICIVKFKNTV
ncbi:MAG TPA: hypothetical protein ENI61_06425 [Ignavibacteria bacterium]|nr:hypothetical protein [Ignavibacteria bacterium]